MRLDQTPIGEPLPWPFYDSLERPSLIKRIKIRMLKRQIQPLGHKPPWLSR